MDPQFKQSEFLFYCSLKKDSLVKELNAESRIKESYEKIKSYVSNSNISLQIKNSKLLEIIDKQNLDEDETLLQSIIKAEFLFYYFTLPSKYFDSINISFEDLKEISYAKGIHDSIYGNNITFKKPLDEKLLRLKNNFSKLRQTGEISLSDFNDDISTRITHLYDISLPQRIKDGFLYFIQESSEEYKERSNLINKVISRNNILEKYSSNDIFEENYNSKEVISLLKNQSNINDVLSKTLYHIGKQFSEIVPISYVLKHHNA